MNLVVDIGNTRMKAALVEGDRVIGSTVAEPRHPAALDALVAAHVPQRALVSSTGCDATQVVARLRRLGVEAMEFTAETPVPLDVDYLTPRTLGRDRLAAAAGAAALAPGRAALVFDFGTALTVDLLTCDADGRHTFRGGFISPGVHMRLRALHDYTARLPLCSAAETEPSPGRSTEQAIVAGVMQGMTYEIEGHIGRMEEKIAELQVFFTGGDAKYFVKRIKNTIFANCDLVFLGLNRILEFNASEKMDR